ncbi:MAG: serpin [Dehalococcoides mccartyi]
MKTKLALSLLAVVSLFTFTACAGGVSAEELKSNKDRIISPNVSQQSLNTQVQANNDLAFKLYRYLKGTEEGNFFYSPFSISIALAMTYAGADTATKTEMQNTLNYLLPDADLHAFFNFIDQELNKREAQAKEADEGTFELKLVNAIWGQKDYTFLSDFLDTLAQNYGAGLRVLDFAANSEEARKVINDWVSDATKDKIKDLIPADGIDATTRLVLTNAIYFNAAWAAPFDEENTQSGLFYLQNGTSVNVQMLRQIENHGYYNGDDFQAVELAYAGNGLSMVIILPDEGKFAQVEDALSGQMLAKILSSIKSNQINLSLPKFSFESKFTLKDALSSLGMPTAFGSQADFSKMDGGYNLMIGDVFHKSFISVSEDGTEAAAATAVSMNLTSAPTELVTLSIDRAFIFCIVDMATGTTLFTGRVIDPTA